MYFLYFEARLISRKRCWIHFFLPEKIKMYLLRKLKCNTRISIGNSIQGQAGELETPESGKKQQCEGRILLPL